MCSLAAMGHSSTVPDYQPKRESTEEQRKCGDISLTLATTSLTLHCMFCDFYIDTLEQFLNHLKSWHTDIFTIETTHGVLRPEVQIKQEVLELTVENKLPEDDIRSAQENNSATASDPLMSTDEQNDSENINIKCELNDSMASEEQQDEDQDEDEDDEADEEWYDDELKNLENKKCNYSHKPKYAHICRLIHYIHEHPILWNTQLSDHFIVSKRTSAIESITSQFRQEFPNLNIDSKYVRIKVGELKNLYFNYHKSKKKPNRNTAQYYELLHFLKDHGKSKKAKDHCPICKKDVVYVEHHMKKYHAGINAPQKCSICEEILPSAKKLQNHIRVFHRCYQCDHCSRPPFTTARVLRSHIESKHPEVQLPPKHPGPAPGPRERICELCGQQYKSQKHLRSHIKRVHLQLRPYSCCDCPRSFKNSEKLRAHRNSVHLNNREYACDICTKAFFSRKTLVQHKQLHSDVKNYECRVCGKAFRQAPALHSHMKTHP